ncbi:MAG: PaaI family thioesterase [Ruminococcaceae bacterium]|nr:PaaI family thioesterase [Oscillospiraceae bacterium]
MANLKQLNDFFQNDLFATKLCGIRIKEAGYHCALCTMPLTENHCNARGSVMGGAIFTLADFAAAVAANSELCDEHVISLHADISYLSVAKGELLYAEASSVKHGKSTTVYQVDISDDLGTKVAQIIVTGYILKTKPPV